MYTAF